MNHSIPITRSLITETLEIINDLATEKVSVAYNISGRSIRKTVEEN